MDIIVKKRDGLVLTKEEIDFLLNGYVNNKIPDYQLSAFCMAVFFKGMNLEETVHLTHAMIESGQVINLKGINGPVIDKHSTGGVGDKVSLILAPLAATCGIKVPMMCGRSLGHTGGTIDKLEAIPGYQTTLTEGRLKEIIEKVNFAFMSQSNSIVPADKRLYALRDVTATVESVPLITASILSKKFAEGAQGFVFDVKCGAGAFMKKIDQAQKLSSFMVETARQMDKKVNVLITDMNQPLGKTVGNALEVKEAVACLKGTGPEDVMKVTIKLVVRMLIMSGICNDSTQAEELCKKKLADGSALQKLIENVQLQGGNPQVITDPGKFSRAKYIIPLKAWQEGYITDIDAYRVGLASVITGAGRAQKEDRVLPQAGIELFYKCGDYVKEDTELCLLHGEDEKKMGQARQLLKKAYTISKERIKVRPLILKQII